MNYFRKPIILSIIALAALNPNTPANAFETIHHETKLVVTMAGIKVGKLAMAVNVANGYYSIAGFAKTSGASKLFSKAKGTAFSGGRYLQHTLTNTTHRVRYTTKKKKGSVDIKFGNNGVETSKVVPAAKNKPGTILVKPDHLKSVEDPIKATLVSVKPNQIGNGAAICNRTVPVYDGKSRFNLKMRFKGTRKVVTRGFKGLSYVCGVRYIPVAGHRPHKKDIKRMAANKSLEIALARIGNSSLYSMIQFKVKTQYGTVVGNPSYYRVVKK